MSILSFSSIVCCLLHVNEEPQLFHSLQTMARYHPTSNDDDNENWKRTKLFRQLGTFSSLSFGKEEHSFWRLCSILPSLEEEEADEGRERERILKLCILWTVDTRRREKLSQLLAYITTLTTEENENPTGRPGEEAKSEIRIISFLHLRPPFPIHRPTTLSIIRESKKSSTLRMSRDIMDARGGTRQLSHGEKKWHKMTAQKNKLFPFEIWNLNWVVIWRWFFLFSSSQQLFPFLVASLVAFFMFLLWPVHLLVLSCLVLFAITVRFMSPFSPPSIAKPPPVVSSACRVLNVRLWREWGISTFKKMKLRLRP